MQTFNIEITETLQRIITLEAESLSEAVTKVKQSYFNEEIILNEDDLISIEFDEFSL